MFIRRKYKGEITMFGPSTGKKQKRNGFKKVIIFFVVVGLLVFLTSLILKEKDVKQPVQEDTMSQEDVSVLTDELARFMVVPDEEPLIFTISDVDFLVQEQRFFENANNGDILFIFPKSEKAVVYSPKRERIINAGPVNFDQPDQIQGMEANN